MLATAYLALLVAMAVLDGCWLGFIVKDFYRRGIGHLMAERINVGRCDQRDRLRRRDPGRASRFWLTNIVTKNSKYHSVPVALFSRRKGFVGAL
jgi:hypothetical protein